MRVDGSCCVPQSGADAVLAVLVLCRFVSFCVVFVDDRVGVNLRRGVGGDVSEAIGSEARRASARWSKARCRRRGVEIARS